jgi:hypothetical protein
MSTALAILVGVLTGLVASVVFWLILAKALRPKVRLCPTMSQFFLPDDVVPRCQIKFVNYRRRPAVDIRLDVSYRLPDLIRQGSTEVLRASKFDRPWLDGHTTHRHTIRPNQIEASQIAHYPPHFRKEIGDRIAGTANSDLVTFLQCCPGSQLDVTVSAVDSFSGSFGVDRRIYEIDDIVTGRHGPAMSCEHTGVLHEQRGILATQGRGADDHT